MGLDALLRWLLDRLMLLVPFRLVSEWEQGVRVFLGNTTKLLTSTNGLFGTGLHPFWILLGSIEVDETNVQIVEPEPQTVLTRDRVPVTFSLSIEWRVVDLQKMWTSIHSPAATVLNAVQATAADELQCHDFDQLDELFGPAVHTAVVDELEEWGVELIEVGVINFTSAQPIRLIGST